MGGFFQELARKLAERWVGLLLLPGALFVAGALLGVRLGHAHALDPATTATYLAAMAEWAGQRSGGVQAALVVAGLLATGGVGLVVQAMAGITRALWLGQWPPVVARWRVGRREARWHRLVEARRTLERQHPVETREPHQQAEIDHAANEANRVAMTRPGRPTWMGDRMHAVERIAQDRYSLDLPFAWPRLWLVLPDNVRTEITTANASFASAVLTGSWAWPAAALGIVWWPAAFVAVVVGVTGWVRSRGAITGLSSLTEAALDLYGRTLATELGVADENRAGVLTPAEGKQITAVVRKGR
jgi:hypothetical protein